MQMKAIYLSKKGGAESLISGEIQRPNPNAGQVLVKVHATAMMPTEFQWTPTFQTQSGALWSFPIVLAHEFSGVVEDTGPNVGGLPIG